MGFKGHVIRSTEMKLLNPLWSLLEITIALYTNHASLNFNTDDNMRNKHQLYEELYLEQHSSWGYLVNYVSLSSTLLASIYSQFYESLSPGIHEHKEWINARVTQRHTIYRLQYLKMCTLREPTWILLHPLCQSLITTFMFCFRT